MKNNYKSRTVIITGVSSGFGLLIAKKFLAQGFRVYGLSRTPVTMDGLTHYKCDITKLEECEKVAAEIYEKERQVDILVNNAGIGVSGAVENTSVENIEKIFKTNVMGTVYMTKAVLPYMRKQNSGRIVNMSSFAAWIPLPFQAFYSASKAATTSLMDALRAEVHPFNVKIVNIMPGDAKTNFTKNRIKETSTDWKDPYEERCNRAISAMERDEQNGINPQRIADIVYKVSLKRRPPLKVIVGGKYKFFKVALWFVPQRLKEAVVRKMYG